jgi:hypothetical protein
MAAVTMAAETVTESWTKIKEFAHEGNSFEIEKLRK